MPDGLDPEATPCGDVATQTALVPGATFAALHMAAVGPEQKFSRPVPISAFGGKADEICSH
jgi:hypothetical protein